MHRKSMLKAIQRNPDEIRSQNFEMVALGIRSLKQLLEMNSSNHYQIIIFPNSRRVR